MKRQWGVDVDKKENRKQLTKKPKIDINTLLEKKKEIEDRGYSNFTDWKQQYKELKEIDKQIDKLKTKEKADKVGGYTKKLNDLCEFTRFSDISLYPEELQKHIYDNYKVVYDKYPQIKYGGLVLQKIGGKDSSFGRNASSSNIVELNTYYYDNLDFLKEEYDETVKNGYHPQGTDYNSIIAHELGHALQKRIEGEYKISASEIKTRVLKESGIKRKNVGTELSKYATEETDEFFAEAFSEYVTSKTPRPLAIAFGKVIDEILKN